MFRLNIQEIMQIFLYIYSLFTVCPIHTQQNAQRRPYKEAGMATTHPEYCPEDYFISFLHERVSSSSVEQGAIWHREAMVWMLAI